MKQKLFALFSKNTILDDLLDTLSKSKNVTDFSLFTNSEATNNVSIDPEGLEIDFLRAGGATVAGDDVTGEPLAPATPSVSVAKSSGVFMFGGTELEAQGLSEEVARYFSRSVASGSRVIMVETRDAAATELLLKDAGGVVSRGQ